jgi:5-methylcytosine-specific restriction endonuclease McrA
MVGKWTLDVHHLDHDKENNEPENLMTLCKNCHASYHGLEHEYGDSEVAWSVLKKFIKALLN